MEVFRRKGRGVKKIHMNKKSKDSENNNIKRVMILNEETLDKINELTQLLALEEKDRDFRTFLNQALDRAIRYFKTKNRVWKWNAKFNNRLH